jgi:hypothetical protein
MLNHDLNYLSVEYGTILDNNNRVLVDINFNRTGRTYDPHGLVSRVKAHPERGVVRLSSSHIDLCVLDRITAPVFTYQQLKSAHLVHWEELEDMQCPIYREAFTKLLDNDETHPFDTGGAWACVCACVCGTHALLRSSWRQQCSPSSANNLVMLLR